VGEGKARFFDGTYEELSARRDGTSDPVVSAAKPVDRRSGRRDPQQRPARDKQAEAERRNARYRATKELRQEVRRVEQELGRVEGRVAELNRQLADPEVYADGGKVKELVAEHARAKDEAAELMDRWERAQLQLEEAEASVQP
jgi:ATP-binding cassette, subfamily F, member 3